MYDAIIVGARCAGAPTAMLLARQGYRVLLVDRATFPSDVMSGHYIHQPGVALLKRWGLLNRLAATGSPTIRQHRLNLGAFELVGQPPATEDGTLEAYAPRRTVLDKLLVDAAVEAGAELREGFSVLELLYEGERVVGLVGRSAGGAAITERARLVIGADGPRSLVARSVGAPAYDTTPSQTTVYYSYWSGLPLDGLELFPDAGQAVVMFPTNDDLTLVAACRSAAQFESYRADIERNHFQTVAALAPLRAEQMRAGRREERFRGTGDLPGFFRQPYGPGWALVGDAGFHIDPIIGQGITNAFRDADLLSAAIDAGFSGRQPLHSALAEYELRRNQAAQPLYRLSCEMAKLQAPTAEQVRLMEALRGNQEATDRYMGTIAGTVPLDEFYAPENLERIVAVAA